MRTYFACSVILAALSLTTTQVLAQGRIGDPVTYTQGNVIYTAVLDPDLDTVSDAPFSTIRAGAVLTTAVATTTAAAAGGAALGGGGGALTTQTGLQPISGYTPPQSIIPPPPSQFSSGTILQPSEIPGYTGEQNTGGISSDGVKLSVANVVVGTALKIQIQRMQDSQWSAQASGKCDSKQEEGRLQ